MRVTFGGIAFGCPLRPAEGSAHLNAWTDLTGDNPRVVQPFWTSPSPTLSLDIDEWSHPLTDLIDDRVEFTLHRRDFALAIPAVVGPRASHSAHLVLRPDDASAPAVEVPATLSVSPEGATLDAELPRNLGGSPLEIWLRLGPAGGSPACELPWRLVRDGRHLTVSRSSVVHLR
jgi:hypothetical protein